MLLMAGPNDSNWVPRCASLTWVAQFLSLFHETMSGLETRSGLAAGAEIEPTRPPAALSCHRIELAGSPNRSGAGVCAGLAHARAAIRRPYAARVGFASRPARSARVSTPLASDCVISCRAEKRSDSEVTWRQAGPRDSYRALPQSGSVSIRRPAASPRIHDVVDRTCVLNPQPSSHAALQSSDGTRRKEKPRL
jgi:hypothetical protein